MNETEVYLDVTTGRGRKNEVVGRVAARPKMWTNKGSIERITPKGTVITTEGRFPGGVGLRVCLSQAETRYGYEEKLSDGRFTSRPRVTQKSDRTN